MLAKERSVLRRPLRVLALTAILAVIMLRWLGDGLFYHPDAEVYGTPADYGPLVEEVSFAAPGGPRLHGWWMPAAGQSLGTVVYCHGNAANLTRHARYVSWLPARGYSVLLFDYRGYGESAGTVTRAGTVADATAAIDFALSRDPERVVVFGHSLGGAVGLRAAADRPAVRGVIAESTFSNYRGIARAKTPWLSWLVPLVISAGYDPDAALHRLAPAPVLVIHGGRDPIVPIALGQQLYERASEPKELWVVPEAAHASPWTVRRDEFERRFEAFLVKALASARRPG